MPTMGACGGAIVGAPHPLQNSPELFCQVGVFFSSHSFILMVISRCGESFSSYGGPFL